MELTDSLKSLLKETASQLKGAARRHFQAQTVMLGRSIKINHQPLDNQAKNGAGFIQN